MDDMHVIGPTLDVGFFFTIIVGILNIKAFSVINKMCSLVSTRVGLFYIISSLFFYF